MTKTCTKCNQTKPLNEFRRDNSKKSGYRQPCQNCNKKICVIWQREKYQNSPEYRQRAANKNITIRAQVLQAYGNKCACCGENEPKFLGIDHIHNDGAEHRRELKIKGGGGTYSYLKKNGFPKDRFQLLCHNCNFSKGLYGECPHTKK